MSLVDLCQARRFRLHQQIPRPLDANCAEHRGLVSVPEAAIDHGPQDLVFVVVQRDLGLMRAHLHLSQMGYPAGQTGARGRLYAPWPPF
jgi:hypothetical protein